MFIFVWRSKYSPVNASNDLVHPEGRVMVTVLVPNGTPMSVAIMGLVESVVDGDNDGQEP